MSVKINIVPVMDDETVAGVHQVGSHVTTHIAQTDESHILETRNSIDQNVNRQQKVGSRACKYSIIPEQQSPTMN